MAPDEFSVQGTVESGFEPVRRAFERNFSDRGDVGSAFSAYLGGRKVADLWGGQAALGRPWKEDTLACTFSTSKAVTALAIQILEERGKLDIEAPVAAVWPEFAAAGKQGVTVRMVLQHRGALPWFPDYARVVSLDNPFSFHRYEEIIEGLAAAPPAWPPGTKTGYQSFTYGWILAEVVRRVSGRSLGRFIREEICEPLGARDYWIGLPESEHHRVAPIIPDPVMDSDEVYEMMNPSTPPGMGFVMGPEKRLGRAIRETFDHPRFWSAEQGAVNPLTDARSLARIYAMLAAGGELDGVRIVSAQSIDKYTRVTTYEPDAIWPTTFRIGLGYMRSAKEGFTLPNEDCFGHPGLGGAMAYGDSRRGLGVCFVPCQMVMGLVTDPRMTALSEALYDCLPA